jgi:AcrR family transcriptional regulator
MQYPIGAKSTESGGRVQQKQRTRQALLDAVTRILTRGEVPTIEGVAGEARVSRATAYRYYSRVDALVADAFFTGGMPGPEEAFPSSDGDPVARVLVAERIIHDVLLADEIGMHVILREFVETWLGNPPASRPPRPGRRMPLIEAAIQPSAEALGSEGTRRLGNALALVIGLEALISMRDVCGLDQAKSRETIRWAIRALVNQAFSEAGVEPAGNAKSTPRVATEGQ